MIVAVTLAPGALPGLAAGLDRLGHRVVDAPLLHFRPPERWTDLDTAIGGLHRYRAIALTSPRAAVALARRLEALGHLSLPSHLAVWAIGPATAAPLAGYATVRVAGTVGSADALRTAMLSAGEPGPVLYPCAEEVRSNFAQELREQGVRVDELIAYRAVLASEEQTARVLGEADVAIVGSHRVLERAAASTRSRRRPTLVCLGPATAATARRIGWPPGAVAEMPTTAGTLAAVAAL